MGFADLCFIDANGYHFPDFPTLLSYVQGGFLGIYGSDTYVLPDSQDGQWLSLISQMAYDSAAVGSSIYSSFSPATAQGAGLSRIVKINGMKRDIATFSTATVSIGGTYGTVINNGIAQDTLGQKWSLPAIVTIPISGTIDVTATSVVIGAINAGNGTINSIFTPTQGWQTVTNAGAAIPGAPIETDSQLRSRQSVSTANPSLTVLDGTVSGVNNLTGVIQAKGYENDTGSTDGNGLPPHSICIVVDGGVTQQICDEILLHKTPGTKTYGNTSATSFDAHGLPVIINYNVPTAVTIGVVITITQLAGYSSGFISLIQAAVAAYINSLGIGANVILSKIYYPAYLSGSASGQTYNIEGLTLSANGGSAGTSDISIGFSSLAVCSATVNVTIVGG